MDNCVWMNVPLEDIHMLGAIHWNPGDIAHLHPF